jgi:hypothetical protein
MGRPTSRWESPVELDELDRRAEERRGSPRFCDALLSGWPCVAASPREHTTKRRPPGSVSCTDHPAATELDISDVRRRQHRQGV